MDRTAKTLLIVLIVTLWWIGFEIHQYRGWRQSLVDPVVRMNR